MPETAKDLDDDAHGLKSGTITSEHKTTNWRLVLWSTTTSTCVKLTHNIKDFFLTSGFDDKIANAVEWYNQLKTHLERYPNLSTDDMYDYFETC